MRMLLRWISILLARRKKLRPPEHDSTNPELEAARLLMLAAARTDIAAVCVRKVGEALVELSRTLPNPVDDSLWGRVGE